MGFTFFLFFFIIMNDLHIFNVRIEKVAEKQFSLSPNEWQTQRRFAFDLRKRSVAVDTTEQLVPLKRDLPSEESHLALQLESDSRLHNLHMRAVDRVAAGVDGVTIADRLLNGVSKACCVLD